ncbi:hypothetical protein BH24PSE2_BH24PSE2_04240 [soil metagenome]
MSVLVLELNDAGLIAADEGGILLESPGFAVVEPKRTIVGEPAWHSARLNPRWTNNRFWDELSLEPVRNPTARIRSHGDLVFAHLDDLRRQLDAGDREVVFAVPGNFGSDQLALLLGIARECGLQATGLVDAAVAAATQAAVSGDLLHVDILLHRVVLTQIRHQDRLTRVGVDQIDKVGLAALRESWVDLIADTYVGNTRFDPLHRAESEQALYDRLPAWLSELEQADSTLLEMQSGAKTHRVTLTRDSLLGHVREQYGIIEDQLRAIQDVHPAQVLVTERIARLPGLTAAIARAAGSAPSILEQDATARGVLAHLDQIRSEGAALSFITALPAPSPRMGARQEREITAPIETRGPETPLPTHVLHRARAYPIGSVPCEVGSNASGLAIGRPLNGIAASCSIFARRQDIVLEKHETGQTFVNDEPVAGETTLELGDRVRVGVESGDVLELIIVVDAGGA